MKKSFYVILLFFSTIMYGEQIVNAEEFQGNLYIESESINDEIIKQAQNNWKFYTDNLASVESKTVKAANFYLGTPFLLKNEATDIKSELAYFPIIDNSNGKIIYLFSVETKSEEPKMMISSQYVEILNSLSPTDDKTNFELYLDKENQTLETKKVEKDKFTRNIKEPLSQYSGFTKRSTPNETIPEYTRKIIPNWKISETQTFEPWCSYFSLSTMINSVHGSTITSAENFIRKQYPTATDEQLYDEKFVTKGNLSDTIKVMQREYSYTLDLKAGRLNSNEVVAQIDKVAPIFTSLTDVTPGDSGNGHAVVIIGYVKAKDPTIDTYYYLWNPWWNKVMFTSEKNLNKLMLGYKEYAWTYSGINFRKEALKVPLDTMNITEVSKTVMVNMQSKTIDTLPWGRNGFTRISTSSRYTGMVFSVTQDSGSYVYSPELKGWIDKKGVTEVTATNTLAKIENSGFSIDLIPWVAGIHHEGYTKDHIGQQVKIKAKSGSYYFVPDMGWMDKKSFSVTTQKQIDAIKNTNSITNNKWSINNVENHATVLGNGKTVDTLPWGKKGYQYLESSNNYTNKYVRITQDAGSYVYSPDLNGWIDKKGLNMK